MTNCRSSSQSWASNTKVNLTSAVGFVDDRVPQKCLINPCVITDFILSRRLCLNKFDRSIGSISTSNDAINWIQIIQSLLLPKASLSILLQRLPGRWRLRFVFLEGMLCGKISKAVFRFGENIRRMGVSNLVSAILVPMFGFKWQSDCQREAERPRNQSYWNKQGELSRRLRWHDCEAGRYFHLHCWFDWFMSCSTSKSAS